MSVKKKPAKPKPKIPKIPQRDVVPPPKEFYDRQPEEGQRAWAAFCAYRDMGPKRSIAKVSEKLGMAEQVGEKWSRTYRWVERVALWQRHQDDIFADARAEHLRDMAMRHTAMAMKMQKILYERLKTLDHTDLTPQLMAQWVKVATNLERLAMGASTVNVAMPGGGTMPNTVTVQLTQEERMREIRNLTARLDVCGHD